MIHAGGCSDNEGSHFFNQSWIRIETSELSTLHKNEDKSYPTFHQMLGKSSFILTDVKVFFSQMSILCKLEKIYFTIPLCTTLLNVQQTDLNLLT